MVIKLGVHYMLRYLIVGDFSIYYCINIDGLSTDQGTDQGDRNLGPLSPTLENVKYLLGFGVII
jgi:hypothetical protein